MRSRFSRDLHSSPPAPLVQVRYGICSLGYDISGICTSRDRRCCPCIHSLPVPSPVLHCCWRAFPLSLHTLYYCISQGAGMSLAQRVIFVPMWSFSRGSCSVMGEPQSQELLGGMSRMPLSLFSLLSYFYLYLRLFFPLEILYGSTILLLAGK